MRRNIDVGSLSVAVSRPGIDPRIWLCYAEVTALGYDKDVGIFADIQLQDGTYETALVGAPYTADEAGLFCPLAVGDSVLVAMAMGDPNHGPVIISQVWNKQQKPAPEMSLTGDGKGDEPTQNVVWRIRQKNKLQIFTKDGALELTAEGSGGVTIKSTGTAPITIEAASQVLVNAPEVLLGPAPGTGVARIGDMVQVIVPAMVVGPGAAAGSLILPALPLTPTLTGGVPAIGQIVSGSTNVRA